MNESNRQVAFLGVVAFCAAVAVHAALAGIVVVGSWSPSHVAAATKQAPAQQPTHDWLPASSRSSPVTTIVFVLVVGILYLLPPIIAFLRGHHNRFAILALDICLGWIILGWIVALIWAFTAVQRPTNVSVHFDDGKRVSVEAN